MEEINKLLPLLGSTLLVNACNQFEEYDLELNEQATTSVKDEKVDGMINKLLEVRGKKPGKAV